MIGSFPDFGILTSRPSVDGREKSDPPKMWQVLLINDDVTPLSFAKKLLVLIFNRTEEQIVAILKDVHTNGFGVIAEYTLEVAESKVFNACKYAVEHGNPQLRLAVRSVGNEGQT